MTTMDEPMLDGMPEVPPAWVRPAEGVRLSAQTFEWMLANALAHASADEEMPVLCAVRLVVADGLLTALATDRYTMSRERKPISQTCLDFDFLLRATDASSLRTLLKVVLRGVDKDERHLEPCDLALEQTAEGPMLRVLGQDLDVRFTEQHDRDMFPDCERLTSSILDVLDSSKLAPFDTYLNPTLAQRVVAAQAAGRKATLFRWRSATTPRRGKSTAIVVQPSDMDDDDLTISLMPINLADR